MSENKMQIILEMLDKASPEFKKANQAAISEVNKLEKETTKAYKNIDASSVTSAKSLARMTVTIASMIQAWRMVTREVTTLINVGRDMDSSFNQSLNSFDISILRVRQSLAQELIPYIQTAADFWTEFLNNSVGSSGGFAGDLKKANTELEELESKLERLNNSGKNFFQRITGRGIETGESKDEIIAQIELKKQFIATLQEQKVLEQDKSAENIALLEATQYLREYTDLLKENQTLFLANKIGAEEYFSILTSSEVAANQESQIRADTLRQIAELENQVNNRSLLDFIKGSNARIEHLKNVKNAAVMTNKQILEASSTSLSTLSANLKAAGESNKAFAKAGQAVAISVALINTYLAVQKARALGPPLGPILAAVELAAGLLNVSNIASQKFAVGTPNVPRDMMAEVHRGETIIPATFAESIRRGELSLTGGEGSSFGDINIFIQGGINSAGLSIEAMAEKLGFEFERNVRLARG